MRPTFERVQALLSASPATGAVHWRVPMRNGAIKAGTEAGMKQESHGRGGKSYWVVGIDGKLYRRGRLMFLLVHGRWPEPCVDHINGDSLDDRIENLREATIMQNCWNHKGRRKRLALPMGVRLTASGRFAARLICAGVTLYLGAYDTIAEAHAIYQAKRKEMFREFA